MSHLTEIAKSNRLEKLTGTIKSYKKTRGHANFFFAKGDRSAMGLVAIAAAAVGAGGAAMGTAMASSDLEEEADYVEFTLAGKPVRGWLWRSPFAEGDRVEIVGEWQHDHFEVAAIARPKDNTLALYPHCSRGAIGHAINAAKWWLIGTSASMGFVWLFFALVHFSHDDWPAAEFVGFQPLFLWISLGFYIFFGAFAVHTSWRWMKFVRVAEQVFSAFGWPNPSNIDLPKRTKAQRKLGDPAECGVFYFRY